MDRPLRFVGQLDAVFRVLIETPVGCWLINCNGPSPPFFAADISRYERVPAPDCWMRNQQATPAQIARLNMIQPLLDCDNCISDKSLRYRMAADAAQQHQTTTRRILRLMKLTQPMKPLRHMRRRLGCGRLLSVSQPCRPSDRLLRRQTVDGSQSDKSTEIKSTRTSL